MRRIVLLCVVLYAVAMLLVWWNNTYLAKRDVNTPCFDDTGKWYVMQ